MKVSGRFKVPVKVCQTALTDSGLLSNTMDDMRMNSNKEHDIEMNQKCKPCVARDLTISYRCKQTMVEKTIQT